MMGSITKTLQGTGGPCALKTITLTQTGTYDFDVTYSLNYTDATTRRVLLVYDFSLATGLSYATFSIPVTPFVVASGASAYGGSYAATGVKTQADPLIAPFTVPYGPDPSTLTNGANPTGTVKVSLPGGQVFIYIQTQDGGVGDVCQTTFSIQNIGPNNKIIIG